MTDQKTQYVVVTQEGVPPPSSSALLSPHTTVKRGWLRLRQSAHKLWLFEVAASLLSLFIFGSIVGTLLYFNNRIYGDASMTQSNMSRRPILFPVLAFLSTVMRATMLLPVATAIGQLKWSWFRSARRLVDLERFDEAARGILGSVKLMFHLRFRNVAAIGAALTILALPLDALIQSAVLLPSKIETVNRLKTLSSDFDWYRNETLVDRATSYTMYQTMTSSHDVWPETPMVNAVQFGIGYGSGPSDIVKATTIVDCPGGYCEFNKAQTLSMGYKCVSRSDIIYVPSDGNSVPYQTLPGTNLMFYSGGYKNVEDYEDVEDQRIAVETYTTYPTPESNPSYPTTEYETDIFGLKQGPLIARTSMLLDLGNGADHTVRNGTYAFDCALYWDVETISMYVNASSNFTLAGTLDPSVLSTYWRDDRGNWVLKPNKCIVEGEEVAASNETFYRDNCIFWVDPLPHRGLQTMLTDPYNGLMGELFLMESYQNDTGKWNRRNIFTINIDRASWNKTPQQAFDRISSMWKNIAFAASFTIRRKASVQANGSANLHVTGTVSALVFYYSVDWIRLAMPTFIVLCCALFVLYTALLTRKEYAWRRSTLPLLFHGLEDHQRIAQGDVRDFTVMMDIAKEIRVRLTEHVDSNGARFTTQD